MVILAVICIIYMERGEGTIHSDGLILKDSARDLSLEAVLLKLITECTFREQFHEVHKKLSGFQKDWFLNKMN